MRITNQMLADTSRKSGVPLLQGSLLDAWKQASSDNTDSLLAALSKNSDKSSSYSRNNSRLQQAAERLSGYASKLDGAGEDSLYEKARASGDTSEVASNIEGLVDSYNTVLDYLGASDSALNSFYLEELKNCVSDHADVLKAVGVTGGKDGKLLIDRQALQSADVDSLEAAFGGSGFSAKAGYVSGRAAENALAMNASLLGGYSSDESSYADLFGGSQCDFRG